MTKNSLKKNFDKLQKKIYPGRGIILGLDESENLAIQIYWLMGRSNNSRNRIMVLEKGAVKTKAHDESKVEDPSLIIYNALKTVDKSHIVTNGDQTDTIARALEKKGDLKRAIMTRSFEPDEPNFTPRISGITTLGETSFKNFFSIIYRGENGRPSYFFEESNPEAGIGLCFHTYEDNGNPLPTFKRAPYPLPLAGNIDEVLEKYWAALNSENKVSIVVKTINKNGVTDYKIKNKLTSSS